MNLIKQNQIGMEENNILVLDEQPSEIQERYDVLKAELLKHSEIEMITGAMQLPGGSVRDGISVKVENSEETISLNLLCVGDDFFPFFNIKPVAGRLFIPDRLNYEEELNMFINYYDGNASLNPELTEEYILSLKALPILGFNSSDEALGKRISIIHPSLEYIKEGIVVGVLDDFNYSTVFENTVPLLIAQRSLFNNCIMIRLDRNNIQEGIKVFNDVWNEVNPDFPANYTFMKNIYGEVYKNEIYADFLVKFFSLLCLIITNLGLIIFTSFIVKNRAKEIAIRKVNGATTYKIITMLNKSVIVWILVAFIISVPCAYFVATRWLGNFAYKISLDWWIFVLAGVCVFMLTIMIVSIQSFKIATMNPVKSLKNE